MASHDLPLLTGGGVGIGTGLLVEDGASISTYWLPEIASMMNYVHSLINSWKCTLSSYLLTMHQKWYRGLTWA